MKQPEQQLDAYLVGGAVRDHLMGTAGKDRDWVVVGSTPEQMVRLGFRAVGKDFPVFLHPENGEEYALARTERKTSPGYHGFTFSSNLDITLEQDLERRDLTMNAIAMDRNSRLIDPFNGEADIACGVIRHVSEAFKEDPVRILRVARFAARFQPQGFTVDQITVDLMNKMVVNGEADALVPERVWQEMASALSLQTFYRFVEVLRDCAALSVVLPEVDALFGVPQVEQYHPEIDTGIHTLMSLLAAGQISDDPIIMFAVLVHDLGKALTPEAALPSHKGHEKKGLKPIRQLCDRLAVPSVYRDFALKVCEYHLHGHRIHQLKASTVVKLIEQLDGFRNPQRVEMFAKSCLADKRGRTGRETDSDEACQMLLSLHNAALSVDASTIARGFLAIQDQASAGKKIKQAIKAERIKAIMQQRKNLNK